jgi:putative DNA primase/helicase
MINDRQITISAGASRKAMNWQPQTLKISELYEKLRTPARSPETLAEYLALKKPEQDNLKDVGGFVAGVLTGPRRKGTAVAGRDVLTLDMDNIPAGGTPDLLRRIDGLGCSYCVYSTRKHHAAAPRLRILLPTDRAVTADEYEPCARRMAAIIGIEFADPTTFEASRLMYWPSCSSDGEYVYTYADKPLLSADGLLATYADWHNINEWPQVPGAVLSPQKLAAKQGDPLAKGGVVGAFCRVYDIYRAMDELLPGIYDPADGMPNRYTYTGGSTTGGAVVYDSGKFLYSHHATDPCSGKLVNAFDLVRLHKFEDLDDDAKPETPSNRLPSYIAMQELAINNPGVSALIMQERYAEAVSDFDGVPATNEAATVNWMSKLEKTGTGAPAKTLKNFKLILLHDPALAGKIRLNLFTGRVDVLEALPWERPGNSPLWGDTDTTELRIYLEPKCGKATKSDIDDAIAACAGELAYHPVRDYLNGLRWDGAPRLDTLFIDYLGTTDSTYTRAVTRKSFAAAVARIMTPGVKYDSMTVLIGAQGRHKSTILAKMGGAWFSDSLKTFDGKEAMETIQGTWLNEIGEMQAMERSEVSSVKAFLSKQADYYRAAYGRHVSERSRQCVFFGTSNSRDVLTDTTGGRRFWPIDIDEQERAKNVFRELDVERDQLWAEAVMRWRLGETLHLPDSLESSARVEQESHRERHPWEGPIEAFLCGKVPQDWDSWDLPSRQTFYGGGAVYTGELTQRVRVCAAEVWCEAFGKNKGDMTKRNAREINQILEMLPEWENFKTSRFAGKPYGNQRCFGRKTTFY